MNKYRPFCENKLLVFFSFLKILLSEFTLNSKETSLSESPSEMQICNKITRYATEMEGNVYPKLLSETVTEMLPKVSNATFILHIT